MEPLCKKSKHNGKHPITIKAVLADEYSMPISLTPALICRIEDKRLISTIMQELSQKLPLPELQHLKRVRQYDILICTIDKLEPNNLQNDTVTKQVLGKYLKSLEFNEKISQLLCANVVQHLVPATPTKLRWQYDAMQHHWPCKFHANAYLESLHMGTNFTESELKFHKRFANLAVRLSDDLESQQPFGICVDPRSHAIVAMAASRSRLSPVMHCSMVLVDCVARTQNAGAWNTQLDKEIFMNSTEAEELRDNDAITMSGIIMRYYQFIQNKVEGGSAVQFGAERLKEDREKVTSSELLLSSTDNLEKYGPYLCTGYDVYLSQEPCLMCAMALVHSRVRRIFFVRPSANGALSSCFKLHAVKELNHHYEVFECLEE